LIKIINNILLKSPQKKCKPAESEAIKPEWRAPSTTTTNSLTFIYPENATSQIKSSPPKITPPFKFQSAMYLPFHSGKRRRNNQFGQV